MDIIELMAEINIYCDESCHLEHDHEPVMCLGALWVPKNKVIEISSLISAIKEKYRAKGELKWIKVSKSREQFYLELVRFFYENPYLHFRALVVSDKTKLDHDYFNMGSHDTFYYKMQYHLLKEIMKAENTYNIYFDIKDTRSSWKIANLSRILDNYFSKNYPDVTLKKVQHIRSHESHLLQMCDFLVGAVCYANRKLQANKAKLKVIDALEKLSGSKLTNSTPPWEEKFNIFIFEPQDKHGS